MWLPPAWLFPVDRSASLTLRVVLGALILSALLYALGRWWPVSRRAAVLLAGGTLSAWGFLYLLRPAWQRVALAESAAPVALESPALHTVGPGVEVADWRRSLAGETLEELALVRLDPARYTTAAAG